MPHGTGLAACRKVCSHDPRTHRASIREEVSRGQSPPAQTLLGAPPGACVALSTGTWAQRLSPSLGGQPGSQQVHYLKDLFSDPLSSQPAAQQGPRGGTSTDR